MPRPSEASDGTRRHPSRSTFFRGVRLGLPIFLGYLPIGMAFGVLARTTGFTFVEAVACSALALAGAGQFIALSLIVAGASAGMVILGTGVINLRYVLFGSTLSPWLQGTPLRILAWLGFTLTDETFAVNVSDLKATLGTPTSMSGVGAISWLGWVLGTVIGAAGAELVGDPTRWGLQFAMPAMFTALFIALAEDRRQVLTGIAAGAIVLALPLLARVGIIVPETWFILVAALAATTIAAVAFGD